MNEFAKRRTHLLFVYSHSACAGKKMPWNPIPGQQFQECVSIKRIFVKEKSIAAGRPETGIPALGEMPKKRVSANRDTARRILFTIDFHIKRCAGEDVGCVYPAAP